MGAAIQLCLFASAPAPLDEVETYVASILESRKRANASGQLGPDVENIRAAYLRRGPSNLVLDPQ